MTCAIFNFTCTYASRLLVLLEALCDSKIFVYWSRCNFFLGATTCYQETGSWNTYTSVCCCGYLWKRLFSHVLSTHILFTSKGRFVEPDKFLYWDLKANLDGYFLVIIQLVLAFWYSVLLFAARAEIGEFVEYDLDNEDEDWLQDYNKDKKILAPEK